MPLRNKQIVTMRHTTKRLYRLYNIFDMVSLGLNELLIRPYF